jgi:alkanesulfonate monooxygenase SsuD/methylene tetrahydromethanopterin reductase-like flavin-dependent oxidoreductase (luciferase family)
MTTTPLKIGLQLPEVEYVASWAQYLEMARLAEAAGFDSLWMGDHLLYRNPSDPSTGPWECLTVLTALAAVTTRIELGPLVLSTSFRNPAMTAKIAETIDEISGGRFVLGLGAGWNQAEYDAFGFPFDHRFARFTEAFDIIHSLVRTGEVDYTGTYYEARECEIIPRGPQSGAMPIMIGSTGERMLRHTLSRVDRWNIWYADFGNTPDGLLPHLDRVDRICNELGRDPATLERSAAVLVTAPGGSSRSTGAHHERFVPGITGSPDTVGQQLAAFGKAGIDHVQVVLDPITPAAIEWLAPALEIARTIPAGRP